MIKSVNVLVRDEAGRTLLQFRDGAATTTSLLWSFWGGAVDAGDAGPEHTAARELAEELGIDARPDQFAELGRRGRPEGHVAPLLLFRRPVSWKDIDIREGAGAGFFWRRDILRLPVVPAVAWYLERNPEFFADS